MSGPCVEDSNCVHLGMVGSNLQASIIRDGAPTNALVCHSTGLYVPKTRTRYASLGTNAIGLTAGVTNPFGGIAINFQTFADVAHGGFPHDVQIDITGTSNLTYVNDSGLTESVDFGFVFGESDYSLLDGWDVEVGLKYGFFGPADVDGGASAVRVNTGFATGYGYPAFDQNLNVAPFGVICPPYAIRQQCVMQPGETLHLNYRLWCQYQGAAGVNRTVAFPGANTAFINFGGSCWVRAHTLG